MVNCFYEQFDCFVVARQNKHGAILFAKELGVVFFNGAQAAACS